MRLVTGATGFIGRRVVARLVSDGVKVRALLLPGESPDGLDNTEIVYGDVTDPDAVQRAAQGVSHIYHLAAVVGDWGDDAVFHAVNVGGTRNVLDAARAVCCERVIMVSSIVVYGWQMRARACDELSPREHGVGPYSRTKRESEPIALDYHKLGRTAVTVIRPGNVYGPGSRMWVDEIVRELRAGRVVLIGDGDGDAGLAYVDNVVDVIIRAGNTASAAGRIYNANDGSGVTWRQYFGDLAEIVGVAPPRRTVPIPVAHAAAVAMERVGRLRRRTQRPLLTTEAVVLLSARHPVPIRRAREELDYQPISYRDALERVAEYIHGGMS